MVHIAGSRRNFRFVDNDVRSKQPFRDLATCAIAIKFVNQQIFQKKVRTTTIEVNWQGRLAYANA